MNGIFELKLKGTNIVLRYDFFNHTKDDINDVITNTMLSCEKVRNNEIYIAFNELMVLDVLYNDPTYNLTKREVDTYRKLVAKIDGYIDKNEDNLIEVNRLN